MTQNQKKIYKVERAAKNINEELNELAIKKLFTKSHLKTVTWHKVAN